MMISGKNYSDNSAAYRIIFDAQLENELFGWSVTGDGDLNGDGYDDLWL